MVYLEVLLFLGYLFVGCAKLVCISVVGVGSESAWWWSDHLASPPFACCCSSSRHARTTRLFYSPGPDPTVRFLVSQVRDMRSITTP